MCADSYEMMRREERCLGGEWTARLLRVHQRRVCARTARRLTHTRVRRSRRAASSSKRAARARAHHARHVLLLDVGRDHIRLEGLVLRADPLGASGHRARVNAVRSAQGAVSRRTTHDACTSSLVARGRGGAAACRMWTRALGCPVVAQRRGADDHGTRCEGWLDDGRLVEHCINDCATAPRRARQLRQRARSVCAMPRVRIVGICERRAVHW